jgi:hypothetical protein
MLEHFREVWAIFDPEGTALLPLSQLKALLLALGDPLGFNEQMINEPHLQDVFIA